MYSSTLSVIVFFCKQKTAYEMRISDWSSDVCSSDLEFAGTAAGAEFIGARDRKGVPSFAKDYRYKFKTYQWQAQLSHWGQRLTYIGHLQRNDIPTINPFDPAAVFDSPYGPLMVTDALGRSHPTGDTARLDQ